MHLCLPRVLPFTLVRVSGPSMVPALRSGDLILVRRSSTAQAGQVVTARYLSAPQRLVVKRVVGAAARGYTLASDNAAAGGGSDVHGSAVVQGRVLGRWRSPGRAGGRWPWRRVARGSTGL